MNKMLKEKVAIVTGGSRGIGKAIALMLAGEGCHVAFNYHKSKEQSEELKKEIENYGVKCTCTCVDIKDFDGVKEWIEETKKIFGCLDILINNAGIVIDKALMMMSKEDWKEVLDTNLTGAFNAARLCIVTFLKQKSGDIINISSVSGKVGLPRQTNYSASKGGLDSFTRALAKEVAPYGVRVNAVAPGYTETEILKDISQAEKDKILKSIPLGRLAASEEIAGCVKFLLSKNAEYITGQIIQIDGGLAIQ